MVNTIKIFGHRGMRGSGNPPENSLAAFKAAIVQNADGIELDVRMSRDQTLTVLHDTDTTRMTGVKNVVRDTVWAELKKLYLLDATGNQTEERIPLYAEVLDLVEQERQHSDFIVNAEIKEAGVASLIAAEIEQRLARGWRAEQFQVSSFDAQNLREMKQLLPHIPRGVLCAGPLSSPAAPWDISCDELTQQIAQTNDIAPMSYNLTLPSAMAESGKVVRIIREAGAQAIVWTYNEEPPLRDGKITEKAKKEMKFLVQHRVDIITDYPKERLAALQLL